MPFRLTGISVRGQPEGTAPRRDRNKPAHLSETPAVLCRDQVVELAGTIVWGDRRIRRSGSVAHLPRDRRIDRISPCRRKTAGQVRPETATRGSGKRGCSFLPTSV